MLSANEKALYAMMEAEGYSHGLCITALRILGTDSQALRDMMLYLDDYHPSESEFIAKMAEICEGK